MKPIRRTLYTGFVVLTDLYGIVICVLLALKLAIGESSWVVSLFNSLFPSVLIPALVMLPGSLYIRRWRLVVQVLPALAIFVIQYGFFFLPRTVKADSGEPQLSLLTFNTRYASTTLDTLVALIREADADVVVLQEFSQPAADRFAVEFAGEYPYQVLYPLGMTTRGKGLLSKYPLVSVEYDEPERPLYQRAQLDFNGTLISIYNVHLSAPRWSPMFDVSKRHAGMTQLLALTAADSNPLLIAGDFNMTDQTDDYGRISSRYADSYREVGQGLGATFPDFSILGSARLALLPQMVRLDHVFHSAHFQSQEAWVWGASSGSDHRPLFVRLALDEEDGESSDE